jgi:hypothetical protein
MRKSTREDGDGKSLTLLTAPTRGRLSHWNCLSTVGQRELRQSRREKGEAKMKLEYGKCYRSRSGQVTTPLFKDTPDPVPCGQTFAGRFTDEMYEAFRTWAPDGGTIAGWTGFDRDLA